jgi:hypothetical protein
MRVRCRAVADPRSNALGSLELESTPAGLWIVYQSVSRYREGYAPGPPAVAAEHRVPWHAVRATRVGAEHLRLEVQEPLSPFAHFFLRDFARTEPVAWIARARPWARLSSSPVILTEFCHELALRFGSPIASEMTLPAGLELGPHPPLRRVPRTGVALSILLLSCAMAALMLGKAPKVPALVAKPAAEPAAPQLVSAPPPAAPVVQSLALHRDPALVPSARATAPAEPPAVPPLALGGGCECIRHESLLWERPPARLTALVTDRRLQPHGTHQHLELEIALVNNGDRELSRLNLSVRIRGPKLGPPGSDDALVERGLYLPGPLAPGQQLRWKVRGRGDRFEVQTPDLGRLDEDGIDAAPADAFLQLAAAPNGVVSLHAGMMLAFLGDARARAALLELRPGRSGSELAYLDRLLDGTADLRVCQLLVGALGPATRVQSCLYNPADTAQTDFELKVRALRPNKEPESPTSLPPELLGEETLAWSGTLAPHRGRRLELTLKLPGGLPSAERRVELVAHRKETRE